MKILIAFGLAFTTALISSSVLASEAEEQACPPELSSGFQMANEALDLDSAARIAIDPKDSNDVMRQIAVTAPLHYLTLFGITAFNGEVGPVPVDPLSTNVGEDFSAEAALDVQEFVIELISGVKGPEFDEAPQALQVANRIRGHSNGGASATTRSCAMFLRDQNASLLWISNGTENCVRLVQASQASEAFEPFPGLTKVELKRSRQEFVDVNVEGLPFPVVGVDQTPQYFASSVTFF